MKNISIARKLAIEIVRAYDPFTAYHLDNTSVLAKKVAIKLKNTYNFTDTDIEYIEAFASLHDIGKMAIPDEILYKESPLTSPERALIETHPTAGKVILDRALRKDITGITDNPEALRILYDLVYHHHERIDGSGYPLGLKGDEVTPVMRIIAVVDSYDAMCSKRAYRKPLTTEKALQIIGRGVKKGELDEKCFNALKEVLKELEDENNPS